jgi:hypothetical protein
MGVEEELEREGFVHVDGSDSRQRIKGDRVSKEGVAAGVAALG